MALMTTLEQLEQIQAAITAVASGQSYRMGDITFTRANLSDLTKREEILLARYNREQKGSSVTRVNFQDGL